eukprot:TRINITY_DN73949_c0_g1_i1.p1 TRINITY_DN73949_c0_g1~~TRINITY_DN73949_c0_g1_i1.p1  ORF type:complete len:147 (-),score=31.47 TRINITY_DN73949_c0_g1_i1:279-719(-)
MGWGGCGKGYGGNYFGGKGWPWIPTWAFKGKGKGKGNSDREKLQVDPSLKVWVGDLPENTSWKELEAHMNQAGKTKWVKVLGGRGKGTAAVVYGTAEEAANAITTLNGSEFKGAAIAVDVWVRQLKEPSGGDEKLQGEPQLGVLAA